MEEDYTELKERLDEVLRAQARKPVASVFDVHDYDLQYQNRMIEANGVNICHIKNPSKSIQIKAVKNNPYAILHIQSPCKRAISMAIKRVPALSYALNHEEH